MTISEYINKLYKHLGGELEEVEVIVEDDEMRRNINIIIPENEVSLFIGSYGETLESLETILRSVFHEDGESKKIVVDIGGYKKKKEEKLVETAIKIAHQVVENKKPYVFGYLNSYERYLIHKAISADESLGMVETFSEDEDGGRVLVVRIKQ